MSLTVYNVAINPELAKLEFGTVRLEPTGHARSRAVERHMPLPYLLNISAGCIVELEAEGREIKKLVVRKKGSGDFDDVYVLFALGRGTWRVLSCYRNKSDDLHSTLKMGRLGA